DLRSAARAPVRLRCSNCEIVSPERSGRRASRVSLPGGRGGWETIYWLTVVATIFLPLAFLTGSFGMNFGWMVKQIHSQLALWLLGVGSLVVGVALIWRLVIRLRAAQAGRWAVRGHYQIHSHRDRAVQAVRVVSGQ